MKNNSLPTITRMSSDEFDQQWAIIKETFKSTNLNMEMVIEIMTALLQVMSTGGYGKITLTILGGYMQEINVSQTRRIAKFIVGGLEGQPPNFDNKPKI